MSGLADKYAALAKKAAPGQNARSEVKLPEGGFGAPRYHLTENGVLLILWSNKINEKPAISVPGERQVVFTDPAGLDAYLERLMAEDSVADWLSELKARYEGDADGILRCRSLHSLTTDDAAVVVPQASFLKLATAPAGATIDLLVDAGRSQVYAPDRAYKLLTSSGHVLDVASIEQKEDMGVILVTGKKSSAVKRAA